MARCGHSPCDEDECFVRPARPKPRMTESQFNDRAFYILLNMARKNKRRWWQFWKARFPVHHHALRLAADDLIREYESHH